MTSTSTPRGAPMTTMVTEPSTPDLVCWIALVTISEVSKVAASLSTLRWLAASVLITNARAAETWLGCPSIVSEPRTDARGLLVLGRGAPGGVSMFMSLPMFAISCVVASRLLEFDVNDAMCILYLVGALATGVTRGHLLT